MSKCEHHGSLVAKVVSNAEIAKPALLENLLQAQNNREMAFPSGADTFQLKVLPFSHRVFRLEHGLG